MAKAIITIDTDACKGCELCVSVCPKQAIEVDKGAINAKGVNPVKVRDAAACVCCASCAVMCPDGVITIQKEVE